MSDDPVRPKIAYDDFPGIVGNMWADLAEMMREGSHAAYIDGNEDRAMKLAWYAEACYWQAQGEHGDSPSVASIIGATKP